MNEWMNLFHLTGRNISSAGRYRTAHGGYDVEMHLELSSGYTTSDIWYPWTGYIVLDIFYNTEIPDGNISLRYNVMNTISGEEREYNVFEYIPTEDKLLEQIVALISGFYDTETLMMDIPGIYVTEMTNNIIETILR